MTALAGLSSCATVHKRFEYDSKAALECVKLCEDIQRPKLLVECGFKALRENLARAGLQPLLRVSASPRGGPAVQRVEIEH
ncbi:hypothetical protein [Mesorhizobium muleiense]|uniref:Uncharacterized protein n=1 Tax=Mesorhizobium muleiense TaxID=1004279 RepID=A0A1G8MR67_9HYPH|nr:hypothetical protein [Mesorhizobium muleiense]MCF6103123.1 hypothetical protein [Mesorhizobium muleiense]SDI70548.1 hypothetical protein SAMN05428953_102649 [Mesorhizobium muleiense]